MGQITGSWSQNARRSGRKRRASKEQTTQTASRLWFLVLPPLIHSEILQPGNLSFTRFISLGSGDTLGQSRARYGMEPETVGPGALSKEDSGEHRWLSQTPRVCTWAPPQLLPHLAPRGEAPEGQLRTNLHPHMQPSQEGSDLCLMMGHKGPENTAAGPEPGQPQGSWTWATHLCLTSVHIACGAA